MENEIYIKAFFGEFRKVTKEKAKDFVTNMKYLMTCREKDKNKIINEKHIKGITVEELLNE